MRSESEYWADECGKARAERDRYARALSTLIDAVDTCYRATIPAMGLLNESRAGDAAQ